MPIFTGKKLKICEGCPNASLRFVPGAGAENAEIFILGEDPGENEIIEGRPFVGKAGGVLDALLASIKVKREDIYATNSAKCSEDRTKKPTRAVLDQCSYYWKKELLHIRPKVLLVLGNKALQATTGREGISVQRGKVRWYELEDKDGSVFKCKMIPTYHPAALFYGGNEGLLPLMLADVQDVSKALVEEGIIPGIAHVPYEVLDEVDSVGSYLARLREVPYFSFDFETTGLTWWKDKSIALAVANNSEKGYVIPFLDEEGDSVWQKKELRLITESLRRLFREHRGIKVALNLKFDMHFMISEFKAVPTGWRFADIGVGYHLLDETLPHDLDTLSDLYTPYKGYKSATAKWKSKMLSCPRDILYPYAATDAVATLLLYEQMLPRLKKEHLENLFQSEMETLKGLFWTETNGMLIDPDRFGSVGEILKEEMVELGVKVKVLTGFDFNVASPDQVAEVLFDHLHLESIKKTPQGKRSSDKESLKHLEGKHLAIAPLLRYREVAKLWSTYIKGFRKHIDSRLRVHPDFRSEGTVSGRIVCRKPNTLNIPREGKSASIRSLFVAKPGYKFVYCDMAQIELMVLAVLSNDKAMLEAFANNKDLHAIAASEMFEVSLTEITSKMRDIGKTTNFGVSYGSQGASLEKFGFSREQISVFIGNYFRKFKGLARYVKRIPLEAERQGYLITPFGRKRRCRVIGDEMPKAQGRAMLNFPSQSIAADIVRIAFDEQCKQVKIKRIKAAPLNIVYDSISWEVADEYVNEMISILRYTLEKPIAELGGYKFRVQIGIGDSWAEAEKNSKEGS